MTTPYNARRTITQPHPGRLTVQITGRGAWHNISFAAALSAQDLRTLSELLSREIEGAYRDGWEAAIHECWHEADRAYRDDDRPDFDIDPRLITVDEEAPTP